MTLRSILKSIQMSYSDDGECKRLRSQVAMLRDEVESLKNQLAEKDNAASSLDALCDQFKEKLLGDTKSLKKSSRTMGKQLKHVKYKSAKSASVVESSIPRALENSLDQGNEFTTESKSTTQNSIADSAVQNSPTYRPDSENFRKLQVLTPPSTRVHLSYNICSTERAHGKNEGRGEASKVGKR